MPRTTCRISIRVRTPVGTDGFHMPDQIILTEKLRRPEVTGLPRPRLEKPVLAAPSGELVLVVAPPGSGKTTLLNRVCATAEFATTWYRVTVEDSSEAAFTSYLGRTLQDGLGAGPGPSTGWTPCWPVSTGGTPTVLWCSTTCTRSPARPLNQPFPSSSRCVRPGSGW